MIGQFGSFMRDDYSLLDKARVKILVACIASFLLTRMFFLVTYLQVNPITLSWSFIKVPIILPLIWLLNIGLLLYGRSWKIAANFFMAALTVVIWTNILFVQAGINVVVAQYCLLAVSCGYYFLGPKNGLIYSLINFLPLIIEVVLKNYFGYEIPGRNISPNTIAYPLLVIANFLLQVYIHYVFFQTHLLVDKQKELLNIKLEAALEESRLHAVAKGNFLLTMSHQLRTPLNVVQGTTNLLLTEPQLPHQEEYFRILQFSSANLMATIDHIVDFSALSEGDIRLTKKPFRADELVRNIYQSFKISAAEKPIKFTLDSDLEQADITVYGDALRLSQILFHLIDNAVKFTECGQISISMRAARVAWDSVTLSFVVNDTGIGISEEQLLRVLNPFFSSRLEGSRQHHGTLGLAIAYQLVHLHGKELKVESEEGRGTMANFSLDYPLQGESAEQAGSIIPTARSLSGCRVLIVDDEPLNILVTKRQLQRWEVTVESCMDGFQAVEKAAERHYDLILMDINMPRMDGFEAAERIRKMTDGHRGRIPVLAVTASTEDIAEGISNSPYIDDYMLKPVKLEELWLKMSFLLERNHNKVGS